MFDTVLVVDPGPGAAQVVGACQRLGMKAVVAHVGGDATLVALADDAVQLAGPEGFGDPLQLVEAARQSGAQAVHPGTGPVSQDEAVARAVRAAGLVWVGPLVLAGPWPPGAPPRGTPTDLEEQLRLAAREQAGQPPREPRRRLGRS